jgi:hypothetical protein
MEQLTPVGLRAPEHLLRDLGVGVLEWVIQPDPAPPKPASRALRIAPERSEAYRLAMVLDTWLRTVLGLTRKRLDPSVVPPRDQQPQTSISLERAMKPPRGRSAESCALRSSETAHSDISAFTV